MTKIMIVENHPALRECITEVIRDTPRLEILHASSSVSDAWEAFARFPQTEFFLLDIGLEREGNSREGLDLAHHIRQNHPHKKILMYTTYLYPSLIYEAYQLGLEGYLLKSSPLDELILAVRTIIQGGRYYRGEVWEALQSHPSHFPF